jgi:hypothetical protein
MNQIDPQLEGLQEVQPDPESQFNLRRVLALIAILGLLLPCGFCWYSTRVEAIENALIPGLLGFIVTIYTLFNLYQKEQNQDQAPPLWRVGIVFLFLAGISATATTWLLAAAGWSDLPGFLILALGGWSLFLAGRRLWDSWQFFRLGVVEENNLTELKMISIEGGHPIHPLLEYRYANKYRGQKRSSPIRGKLPEIRQAIKDGKFQVAIKYLPDNPRVHRFMGWKILP